MGLFGLCWRWVARLGTSTLKFIGIPTVAALRAFFRSTLHVARVLLVPLSIWFILSPENAKHFAGVFSPALTVLLLIGVSFSLLYAVITGLRTVISFAFVAILSFLIITKLQVPGETPWYDSLYQKVETGAAPSVAEKSQPSSNGKDDLEYIDFDLKEAKGTSKRKRSSSSWIDPSPFINISAVESNVRSFLSEDIFGSFGGGSQKFSGLSNDMFFPPRSRKKSYYGFGIEESPRGFFLSNALQQLIQ